MPKRTKTKQISPMQRVKHITAECCNHSLLWNMSIRTGTVSPKQLNFKAIWWVNISSVLPEFNFYPALKSISHGALHNTTVLAAFLSHTQRLHYQVDGFFFSFSLSVYYQHLKNFSLCDKMSGHWLELLLENTYSARNPTYVHLTTSDRTPHAAKVSCAVTKVCYTGIQNCLLTFSR